MHLNVVRQYGGLLVVTLFLAFFAGCGDLLDEPQQPNEPLQQGVVLSKDNPQVANAMAVQNRHTRDLMKDENVVGTATGLTEDGRPAILILTKNAPATGHFPAAIEGVPVVVEVTGVIRAMKGPGGGGVSHKARQTPPIQLGTSGGWRYDLANGYCCGGTLGSLVKSGESQFVMSNYHVLYADIVNGGNGIVANPNDPVIQPGLIDVSCNAGNAQNVATLAGGRSLPNYNVDVAVAQTISGMVRSDGAILEIGTLTGGNGVSASLNQAVKKSGRTTGLSRSTVSGLNANVTVTYDNECAGGTAFTKTFTGQILFKNRRSGYLAGGDSGSLAVEDVTTDPRAVALLYAGSSTIAVGNPIDHVLNWLTNSSGIGGSFSMVGN